MDSDDEFMSNASSQEEDDFEGTQDSEAGSVGDGKPTSLLIHYLPLPAHLGGEVMADGADLIQLLKGQITMLASLTTRKS
jgi:hypothetical protein